MAMIFRMMRVSTGLFAVLALYAGAASAQAPHPCPDNANWNPPNSIPSQVSRRKSAFGIIPIIRFT